jgi:hypothetical protein
MKYSKQLKCSSFEIFAPAKVYESCVYESFVNENPDEVVNETRESKVNYMDEVARAEERPEPEVVKIDLSEEANRDTMAWEKLESAPGQQALEEGIKFEGQQQEYPQYEYEQN